jgi:hypothetical protein
MRTPLLIETAMRQLPDLGEVEGRVRDESFVASALEYMKKRSIAAAIVRPGTEERAVRSAPEALEEVENALEEPRVRILEAGGRALSKIRKGGKKANLTPVETRGLEAIILLVGRPALLIQDGKFFPPPEGWETLETVRQQIQEVLPRVGRIEVTGHPDGLDWIGTGFLVAEDVIMTNRHVAKEFCRPTTSTKWQFEPGMTARIDFKEEFQGANAAEFSIKEMVGVHPTYDLALFRVAVRGRRGTRLPLPLSLSSKAKKSRTRDKVYVVGYPASDSRRNDPVEMRRIFSDIYDVKRLQPGEVISQARTGALFDHDCSTLGGNSGSCVVDLESHEIIGLHFQGKYLEANRAVALWKLATDRLLTRAGVNYA